jgi:hypothetical protein
MKGAAPANAVQTAAEGEHSLRVSPYEYAAAGVLTGLILLGAAVAFMFVLWISSRIFVKQVTVTPQLVELAGGGRGTGDADDLANTQQDEPEAPEPQLDEILESINLVVSENAATYDPSMEEASAKGRGSAGRGDGSGGPGDGQIPRWERWELEFNSNSIAEYRRQLDFFKIELAAFGGGEQKIQYAYNFSAGVPSRREGTNDERIYMIWQQGALAGFDLQLLKQAGIATKGRIVVQFLAPEFENRLAVLEDTVLKTRNIPLKRVKKTTFRIQREGTGYGIAVAKLLER